MDVYDIFGYIITITGLRIRSLFYQLAKRLDIHLMSCCAHKCFKMPLAIGGVGIASWTLTVFPQTVDSQNISLLAN